MGGKQSKGKERSVIVNIDALDTKLGKKTAKKVFTNDDIVRDLSLKFTSPSLIPGLIATHDSSLTSVVLNRTDFH